MTSTCPTCRGPLPCEKLFCIHCTKDEHARDLAAELTATLSRQKQEQEARIKELAAKDRLGYDQERRRRQKTSASVSGR
jgi:hypothetical protein